MHRFHPRERLCRNFPSIGLSSLANRLCEKSLGVLRLGSARTGNEHYFSYLTVRPELCRRVNGYFSHSLANARDLSFLAVLRAKHLSPSSGFRTCLLKP